MTSGLANFFELLPWAEVAEFAGTVGGFLGIVAGVAAMPLLWKGVHDQNLANGSIEGFWDAMQDLSVPFANKQLLYLPKVRWPPIPKVMPHPLVGSDVLLNEKQWMEGRRKGCAAAAQLIDSLERRPAEYKIVRGGRQETVYLTGRFYLYLLAANTNGKVADAIHRIVDQKLRANGKKGWPLRD